MTGSSEADPEPGDLPVADGEDDVAVAGAEYLPSTSATDTGPMRFGDHSAFVDYQQRAVCLASVWGELPGPLAEKMTDAFVERQRHDMELEKRDMALREKAQDYEIEAHREYHAEVQGVRWVNYVVVLIVLGLVGFAIWRGENIAALGLVLSILVVLILALSSGRGKSVSEVAQQVTELQKVVRNLSGGKPVPDTPADDTASS